MSRVTITMRLYGAFRKDGEQVEFTIAAGSPVSRIKEAVRDQLSAEMKALVPESVIANDETILPEDYIVDSDSSLSILPPVCGG